MRCNNNDAHQTRSYYGRPEMTRLYVRHVVEEKRRWLAVGWYCDPNHKAHSWGSVTGCGAVVFDTVSEVSPPRVE